MTFWLVVAGFIQAAVFFFTLLAVRKSADAAKKSADAAELAANTAINLESPQITLESLGLEDKPIDNSSDSTERVFIITMRNYGRSPAIVRGLKAGYVMKIKDLPPKPDYQWDGILMNVPDPYVIQCVMPPDTSLTWEVTTNMTQGEMASISTMDMVVVYWCIPYRDFHEIHWEEGFIGAIGGGQWLKSGFLVEKPGYTYHHKQYPQKNDQT